MARRRRSMLPRPDTPLGVLFSRLATWIPIADFESAMNDYFMGVRSVAEVADYRAKRGAQKKLRKKAKSKYAGFDLLIEAPLRSLPNERWSRIHEELRAEANQMPFRQIHVIGNQDTEPFGFRIK